MPTLAGAGSPAKRLHSPFLEVKKMKNTIYMAVTPDEYELPLFVTDNLAEMADKFHKTKACISSSICHKRQGTNKGGVKFIKIKEEEDAEEI